MPRWKTSSSIDLRRIIFIDAARTTGKDDALGLKFFNLCNCFVIRVYFTVYVVFTDAPCNELVILTTKIDNDDEFFGIH